MKTTLPLFFYIACVFGIILSGCGSSDIDRPPCDEEIPCPQPVVNSCEGKNISSDRWTSLGLEDESVTAIAAHPCNPGIIYAGTQRDFSAGVQGKLLKSTDCGTTWDTLAVGGSYRTIQFSPGNPDVIYAVNDNILKSSDGGQHWQQADEGIHINTETGVSALDIDPQNACVLFAGTGGPHGGDLYKSIDAGTSWRQIEGKELEDLGNSMNRLDSGITSLAINPADPDHIYVGTAQLGDVLRSTDGGNTWETTDLINTGSLIHVLLIESTNEQSTYAGLSERGLHKTNSAGDNWDQITNEHLANTTSIVELEMDHKNTVLHVVTTHADSGRLLIYDINDNKWEQLQAPVTDQNFYYSKLKINVFKDKVYNFFGTSGIYVRTEE